MFKRLILWFLVKIIIYFFTVDIGVRTSGATVGAWQWAAQTTKFHVLYMLHIRYTVHSKFVINVILLIIYDFSAEAHALFAVVLIGSNPNPSSSVHTTQPLYFSYSSLCLWVWTAMNVESLFLYHAGLLYCSWEGDGTGGGGGDGGWGFGVVGTK